MADLLFVLARRSGGILKVFTTYPIQSLVVLVVVVGGWFGGRAAIEKKIADIHGHEKEAQREKLNKLLGLALAVVIGSAVFFAASKTLW